MRWFKRQAAVEGSAPLFDAPQHHQAGAAAIVKRRAFRAGAQDRITGGKRACEIAPFLARDRLFYFHIRITVPAGLQYTGRAEVGMTY
jgi:hypothetical protein